MGKLKNTVIMKNINISLLVLFMVFSLLSCSEDTTRTPFGSDDKTPPEPVTNITVTNTHGGAVIKYDPPTDEDLQYVKAVYTDTKGKHCEVLTSAYVDSLVIEGLGDTNEYKVDLYAGDKFDNISKPASTTINPKIPPVQIVFESLSYQETFGGFSVDFTNIFKADLAIYALCKTDDMFIDYEALYTSREKRPFIVRGLPSETNTFGLYVRDKYDNISDTLFFDATPWPEEQLNKKLFNHVTVIGDVRWDDYAGKPENAWDDNVSNGNFAHTSYPVEFPHRMTIDLGVNSIMSRFKLWQRPGRDVLYQHGAPKKYRIYGCSKLPENPSATDPMAGWTLLIECSSLKPSGLPVGQNSGEDEEYAGLGEEYSFPVGMDPIRYFRIETLESWSGMKCSVISELAFWGQVQE